LSLDEIIAEKINRINSIPDDLITSVEVAQRELYTKLLELLSSLEKKGDVIVKSKKNLALIEQIMADLRLDLENPEGAYYKAVKSFTDEIKVQQGLTDSYFVKIFGEDKITDFAKDVALTTRKHTVNLLLGSSIEGSFFDPVREQITNSIISGASYKETVQSLRQVVIGDATKDGSLQSHVKQIAHDSFAIADRSYTATISDELGAEWFKYRGSEIKTSRPFCKERHQRYFHKKEIEAWGRGEKTLGFQTPDKTGHWTGEIPGTNEKTIFNFCAGFNCRHSLGPVTIERVPKEDIDRAIQQGFYKPPR
jgi:hypothetical protein